MSSLGRWLMSSVHSETKHTRRAPRRRNGSVARNWQYRAWIRTLPSAASGMPGCEAAHTGNDGGMALKPLDCSCIPLTREEHREYHQVGRSEFERLHQVNCRELVRHLTHTWFAYGKSDEVTLLGLYRAMGTNRGIQ